MSNHESLMFGTRRYGLQHAVQPNLRSWAKFIVAVMVMMFNIAPVQAADSAPTDVAGQIGDLRQRALQAVDLQQPATLYMSAKAQAWLDFAFEEYIERDNTGLAEDALQRAKQLVGWLENKQSEGVADPKEIRGVERVREDLWVKLDEDKQNPHGIPCAAPYLGRAEVQLVWGGHELPELGPRHARRYIEEAEQLLKDAAILINDCPQDQAAQLAAATAAAAKLNEVATNLAVARLPESVHFAFDKAEISPATDKVLHDLADTLRAYPWLRLELAGHTDRIGAEKYNVKLSQRRAEKIKQRLVSFGLPADHFTTKGLGKSQLLMQPDGLDARARDRRVQFVISNSAEADTASTKIETQPQESDLQLGERRRNHKNSSTRKN